MAVDWSQLLQFVLNGLIVGALCGLVNGLIVTVGKIEPFIATLGTMGIFRALITWMSDGGSIPIDRALRDPAHPERLLPRYDSGDHLHPSDAGFRAMADAIPLTVLTGQAPASL